MDRCKHVGRLRLGQDHSTLNPQKWLCADCGTSESVWACLKCAHVACGRDLHDHALGHFQASRHPLAMEVRELDVFCFVCGDYVLNDNAEGDLKLLRGALSTIRSPNRRSLRSSAAAAGGEGGTWMEAEGMLRPPSQVALWHRRKVLLGRVLRQWQQRQQEEEQKRSRKLEEERQEQRERREVKRRLMGELAGNSGGPPRKSARLLTQAPRPTLALVPVKFRDPPERLPQASQPPPSAPVRRPSALSVRNANTQSPKPRRYHASLSTRRRRLAPGVTGLRNLGNTCYMNSILQVLSHLQKFRECFLTLDLCETEELLAKTKTSQGVKGVMVGSAGALGFPLGRGAGGGDAGGGGAGGGTGGVQGEARSPAAGSNKESSRSSSRQRMSLCHELHTLFRVMWSGRWSLVSPFAMLHSVWNLIPAFRGYDQQDAQEFLCELLDKVQQELESNGSKRRILMPITQRKLSKQVLKVLNTIFHGQLLSQVSLTPPPFISLTQLRFHFIYVSCVACAWRLCCLSIFFSATMLTVKTCALPAL